MEILRSKRRRGSLAFYLCAFLWLALFAVLIDEPHLRERSVVFLGVGLLLVIVRLLRWGPLLPCFLLGVGVSAFCPAVNRPAYSQILDPLVFGTVGAVIGLILDLDQAKSD